MCWEPVDAYAELLVTVTTDCSGDQECATYYADLRIMPMWSRSVLVARGG